MCSHRAPCLPAARRDRDAARTVARHPEQGWGVLCNGVIASGDTGEILPGGRVIPSPRTAAREPHVAVAAIQALRKAGNEIDPAALRGLIKAMNS